MQSVSYSSSASFISSCPQSIRLKQYFFLSSPQNDSIDSVELHEQTDDKTQPCISAPQRPCSLCCRRSLSQQDIGINWRTRSSCRVLQKYMTKRSAIDALSPTMPQSFHHDGLFPNVVHKESKTTASKCFALSTP